MTKFHKNKADPIYRSKIITETKYIKIFYQNKSLNSRLHGIDLQEPDRETKVQVRKMGERNSPESTRY